MKYPQLVSMPSAVSDWLEEQLEARGVDAVIYAHYILSLLHSDTVEIIYSHDDDHQAFSLNGLGAKKTATAASKKGRGPLAVALCAQASHRRRGNRRGGTQHQIAVGATAASSFADWFHRAEIDAEKVKRNAAIECLTSATEESWGVESLIDELCERLDEINRKKQAAAIIAESANSDTSVDHHHPYSGLSAQELARKYYDAFPALGRPKAATVGTNVTMATKKSTGNKRGNGNSANRKDIVDGKENDVYPSKKPRRPLDETLQESDWDSTESIMYDDLPVYITKLLELVDEPKDLAKKSDLQEATMRETSTASYITSGMNITSSIWSNNLDARFRSIHLDNGPLVSEDWPEKFYTTGITYTDGEFMYRRREGSAFFQVVRKKNRTAFGPIGQLERRPSPSPIDAPVDSNPDDAELLSFVKGHFIPIPEEGNNGLNKDKYADGTTFLVNSDLNPITFRRSDSGGLYADTDINMRNKYFEYRDPNDTPAGLVIKFLVRQNNVACQTDEADVEVDKLCLGEEVEEMVSSCDDCEHKWNAEAWENFQIDDQWKNTTLRDIWSGGEVCHSCLGRSASTRVQTKLREDVSQDGDQLLSDLSHVQKTYMTELPTNELSCDLTDLIINSNKYRNNDTSSIRDGRDEEEESWSFASRVEEDCIIKMTSLPTLRSVTH